MVLCPVVRNERLIQTFYRLSEAFKAVQEAKVFRVLQLLTLRSRQLYSNSEEDSESLISNSVRHSQLSNRSVTQCSTRGD